MSEGTANVCMLCPLCNTPLEVEREYFIPQTLTRDSDGSYRTADNYTDITDKHGNFYLWCPGCNWDYAGMEPADFAEEYPDSVVIVKEEG